MRKDFLRVVNGAKFWIYLTLNHLCRQAYSASASF